MHKGIATLCAVVVFITSMSAVFWWSQRMPDAVDEPKQAAPGPAPNSADKTPAGDHRKAAARATRSVNLASRSAPTSIDAEPAPRSAAAHASTAPVRLPVGTAPQADVPPRKTTAELFDAFLADDPKEVFQSQFPAYHAAVLGEQPDPEWSPAANKQLHDYLASTLGTAYEEPVVDCRQDLCEVRIAGNAGADGLLPQQTLSNMAQQPWWRSYGFDQTTLAVTDKQDRMLFVIFISRL